MHSAQKRERMRRFEEACRRRGLALTVQRRVILEAVLDRNDHPTADQIFDVVRQRIPNVSRTTVYRVLEMLVEIGAITKACSPGATARYDTTTDRHHHFVCLRCGKLIDLDDGEFRHRVEFPAGHSHLFDIQDFTIHFYGICAACRGNESGGHAKDRRSGRSGRRKATSARERRQTGSRRKRT